MSSRRHHRALLLACAFAAYAAVSLVMQLIPGISLSCSAASSLAAAAVIAPFVAASLRRTSGLPLRSPRRLHRCMEEGGKLRFSRRGEKSSGSMAGAAHGDNPRLGDDRAAGIADAPSCRRFPAAFRLFDFPTCKQRANSSLSRFACPALAMLVMASASVSMVASLAQNAAPFDCEAFLSRVVPVGAICLGTGIWEEGLFRVVLLEALAVAFFASGRSRLSSVFSAASVSSLLFALLHISYPPEGAWTVVSLLQFAMKPVQAFLFGFILSLLWLARGRFAEVAGLHAAYDLLALGPSLFFDGSMPATYATGGSADLAALAVSMIPLCIAAGTSLRMFHRIRHVVRYSFDDWTDDR